MRCPECGNENLEPATECQVCGAPLSPLDSAHSHPTSRSGPSDQPLTSMLFEAAVGRINADHYRKVFGKFEARGKTELGWHWPAFFATLGWMLFRRMGREALLYAGLVTLAGLLLFGVLPLLLGYSDDLIWGASVAFLLLAWVLPALLAHTLYYRHCSKLVSQALADSPDIAQAREHLAAMAPTAARGRSLVALVGLAWAALAAAVGAWFWLSPEPKPAPPTQPHPVRAAPTPVANTPPAAPSTTLIVPIVVPIWLPMPMPVPIATPGAVPAPAKVASQAEVPPRKASATSAATAPVAAASAPVAAAPAKVAPSAPARNVAPPAPTPTPPPAPKPTPAVTPTLATSPSGRYQLAIGLFGQPENVQRALDKLRHAGLPVHSDVLQTPKGELTRIWVGPYDSSTQAQEQAAQVDKLGLPATVMKR